MNETAIKNAIIRTEVRFAEQTEFKYTLTLSESKGVSSFRLPLYSITVESLSTLNGDRRAYTAENLFADERKAEEFFDLSVSGLATPIDFPSIVEDMLRK